MPITGRCVGRSCPASRCARHSRGSGSAGADRPPRRQTGRHPLDPPVVCLLHDHSVDFLEILHRAFEDFRGELTCVRLRLLQILERGDDHLRRIAGHVVLIEHLQRELTRFSAGTHGHAPPVRRTRHSLAISIAASAASQPLFPAPGEERSMACCSVSQVITPNAIGRRVSHAIRDSSIVT